MTDPFLEELTGPSMLANLIAELLGIAVTAFVIERYLAWQENRKKVTARELFIETLGRRLDQLILEWGSILDLFATLKEGPEQLAETFGPLGLRFDALNPQTVIEDCRRAREAPDRAEAVKVHAQAAIVPKLVHLTSLMEDVIAMTDAGAILLSSAMVDVLLELRESLLVNLRAIADLRDLIASPALEAAYTAFVFAGTAALSGDSYLATLGVLWRSIPTHATERGVPSRYLRYLPPGRAQIRIVEEFLRTIFPMLNFREMANRALIGPPE